MNKLTLILIAAFASTNVFADDTNIAPSALKSTEEVSINNSLFITEQKQADAIYAYAESIFNEISASVKKEISDNADQQLAVQLTSV